MEARSVSTGTQVSISPVQFSRRSQASLTLHPSPGWMNGPFLMWSHCTLYIACSSLFEVCSPADLAAPWGQHLCLLLPHPEAIQIDKDDDTGLGMLNIAILWEKLFLWLETETHSLAREKRKGETFELLKLALLLWFHEYQKLFWVNNDYIESFYFSYEEILLWSHWFESTGHIPWFILINIGFLPERWILFERFDQPRIWFHSQPRLPMQTFWEVANLALPVATWPHCTSCNANIHLMNSHFVVVSLLT